MHIHKKIFGAKQRKHFCDHKKSSDSRDATPRTGLIKIKLYIYKSFIIFITREVFVRHTVSRNLQMSDTRDSYGTTYSF